MCVCVLKYRKPFVSCKYVAVLCTGYFILKVQKEVFVNQDWKCFCTNGVILTAR